MSATAHRREYVKMHIAKHVELSHRTYGYRRIHAALVRQGEQVSPELVRDLMRELGLVACQPQPFRPVTTVAGADAAAIPDLVGRDVTASAPGEKFVGDITDIPTGEGWLYLATAIDCDSTSGRRLVHGRPFTGQSSGFRPGHGLHVSIR